MLVDVGGIRLIGEWTKRDSESDGQNKRGLGG